MADTRQKQIDEVAASAGGGLSAEAMAQIAYLVDQMRRPVENPQVVARAQQNRLNMAQTMREAAERKIQAEKACGHVRQDGTSAIAWQDLIEGRNIVRRGVCQHCDARLNPYDEDGNPNEDYNKFIRIPTGVGF